jgi:hypothetical protein
MLKHSMGIMIAERMRMGGRIVARTNTMPTKEAIAV